MRRDPAPKSFFLQKLKAVLFKHLETQKNKNLNPTSFLEHFKGFFIRPQMKNPQNRLI